MDEAYSYGYNNTRDASTLTPRKQVEPLVLPDDITNLPALHGYVKYPDGFPAGRIKLEWKRYPVVAEGRSEEHTSELQSLMRTSYAVFCLKKNNTKQTARHQTHSHTELTVAH